MSESAPSRPLWLRFLAGTALVLVGLGLIVIGSTLDGAGRKLAGGNTPINTGATDPLDITAHNSPSLARSPLDPDTLAVASRIDTPRFSCALNISNDGGETWHPATVPFPAGEESPPRCFAPDTAFGVDGTLYVSFVTLKGQGNVPNGAWVSSARPGTESLSTPVRAAGPLAFQVRLSADRSRPRSIYLSWLQAAAPPALLGFSESANPVLVARSDDGGATWGQPVAASTSERARPLAPSPASGPGDELFVLYLDLGGDVLDYQAAHQGQGGEPYNGKWSLVLARSADRGATWSETTVDTAVVPIERIIAFIPPFPSLAVAPDGRHVYAGFHDARQGDADVVVWASADGGASFSAGRRVNDTRERDGTAQYLPKLAVADDGRLDVVYYDRRGDEQDNRQDHVSMQSSSDNAMSFTRRILLSDRSFDSGIGFGSERGMPDLGSRLALVSDDDRALAVWTDTRAGTVASGKQNLAFAVVVINQGSALRTLLVFGGAAVVVAGAIVLVHTAVARRFPS